MPDSFLGARAELCLAGGRGTPRIIGKVRLLVEMEGMWLFKVITRAPKTHAEHYQ